jgi:hypothetical protein
MSIDYSSSLSRLRARRLGTDRGKVSIFETMTKAERYQRRVDTDATKYTLGAMQEVDPDYTRVSNEEGERVAAALRAGLSTAGRYADFRRQGSVPANTHIRGASDVDLLVLGGVYTYDPIGSRALAGQYTPWYARSSATWATCAMSAKASSNAVTTPRPSIPRSPSPSG